MGEGHAFTSSTPHDAHDAESQEWDHAGEAPAAARNVRFVSLAQRIGYHIERTKAAVVRRFERQPRAAEDNDIVRRTFGVGIGELRLRAIRSKYKEHTTREDQKLSPFTLFKYCMFLLCYSTYVQVFMYDNCQLTQLEERIHRYHEVVEEQFVLGKDGDTVHRDDLRNSIDVWIYMQSLFHQMGVDRSLKQDFLLDAEMQRSWISDIILQDANFSSFSFAPGNTEAVFEVLSVSSGVKMEAFANVRLVSSTPGEEVSMGFYLNPDHPSQNFFIVEFFVLIAFNMWQLELSGYPWRSVPTQELLPLIVLATHNNMIFYADGSVLLQDGSLVSYDGAATLPNGTVTNLGVDYVYNEWSALREGSFFNDMFVPFNVLVARLDAAGGRRLRASGGGPPALGELDLAAWIATATAAGARGGRPPPGRGTGVSVQALRAGWAARGKTRPPGDAGGRRLLWHDFEFPPEYWVNPNVSSTTELLNWSGGYPIQGSVQVSLLVDLKMGHDGRREFITFVAWKFDTRGDGAAGINIDSVRRHVASETEDYCRIALEVLLLVFLLEMVRHHFTRFRRGGKLLCGLLRELDAGETSMGEQVRIVAQMELNSWWNWFEDAMVVLASCAAVVRVFWYIHHEELVVALIRPVGDIGEPPIPETNDIVYAFFRRLVPVYIVINALNILLSFFALLKHMRFSWRVRIVLDTLTYARSELGIFLFILMVTFVGFVLMAQLALGYLKITRFSSFEESFFSLFNLLWETFDLSSLDELEPSRNESVYIFYIFYVVFMLYLVVIVLQMVIAVLMESFSETRSRYSEEKKRADGEDSPADAVKRYRRAVEVNTARTGGLWAAKVHHNPGPAGGGPDAGGDKPGGVGKGASTGAPPPRKVAGVYADGGGGGMAESRAAVVPAAAAGAEVARGREGEAMAELLGRVLAAQLAPLEGRLADVQGKLDAALARIEGLERTAGAL